MQICIGLYLIHEAFTRKNGYTLLRLVEESDISNKVNGGRGETKSKKVDFSPIS